MDKHSAFRRTPEYKLWRANIYQRDKWECKICGRKERIEAHHIHPLRSHYEKRFDHDNGITLCFNCHRLIFGKELMISAWLIGLINKNGVNSVELRKDNTEPTQEGNFLKGVTTRSRSYRLEQFITKEIPCEQCGKMVKRHYYRTQRSKKFWCSRPCRGLWMRAHLQGENNPNYKKAEPTPCLYCKKVTTTPSNKHRVKKYCTNSCQIRYEKENGLKKTIKPYLNGRWTKKFQSCIVCGSREKAHYGKGKCMTCYNKAYNSKQR